jgi:hypothetical protein
MSGKRKSHAQSIAIFPACFETANSIDLSVKNARRNGASCARLWAFTLRNLRSADDVGAAARDERVEDIGAVHAAQRAVL